MNIQEQVSHWKNLKTFRMTAEAVKHFKIAALNILKYSEKLDRRSPVRHLLPTTSHITSIFMGNILKV